MYCCKISSVFVLLSSGILIAGLQLPSELTKCKKSDSECMCKSISDALQLFTNGNKDFGIPSLNPFYVEKLEIAADPSKSVKLNQKYENVHWYGMNVAKVKQFKLTDNGKDCKWEIEIFTERTVMEADYQMTGQVLVFPINGYGKCNVTITGITTKHIATCEHYSKKGKSHTRLKNYAIGMTAEKCYFDFPNIIPGNEQISNEVGKTINENSQEIFQDVKGGFEEVLARLHENSANALFSRIPEEDLFLPE